jgi:hypothetical protein
MPKSDVCGNDYDKTFQITQAGRTLTFDSFECAIHAMAPSCAHCGCRSSVMEPSTTARSSIAAQIVPRIQAWRECEIARKRQDSIENLVLRSTPRPLLTLESRSRAPQIVPWGNSQTCGPSSADVAARIAPGSASRVFTPYKRQTLRMARS